MAGNVQGDGMLPTDTSRNLEQIEETLRFWQRHYAVEPELVAKFLQALRAHGVPNKIALQTTPRCVIQPMLGSCGLPPGHENTLLLSLNDHKPGLQFPQPQGAPLPGEQEKKQRGGPRKQVAEEMSVRRLDKKLLEQGFPMTQSSMLKEVVGIYTGQTNEEKRIVRAVLRRAEAWWGDLYPTATELKVVADFIFKLYGPIASHNYGGKQREWLTYLQHSIAKARSNPRSWGVTGTVEGAEALEGVYSLEDEDEDEGKGVKVEPATDTKPARETPTIYIEVPTPGTAATAAAATAATPDSDESESESESKHPPLQPAPEPVATDTKDAEGKGSAGAENESPNRAPQFAARGKGGAAMQTPSWVAEATDMPGRGQVLLDRASGLLVFGARTPTLVSTPPVAMPRPANEPVAAPPHSKKGAAAEKRAAKADAAPNKKAKTAAAPAAKGKGKGGVTATTTTTTAADDDAEAKAEAAAREAVAREADANARIAAALARAEAAEAAAKAAGERAAAAEATAAAAAAAAKEQVAAAEAPAADEREPEPEPRSPPKVKCDTCRCWIPEEGIEVISNLYKCIDTEACARNAAPAGKRRRVNK